MPEITAPKFNWSTGEETRVPVNEAVLQDVVDYLFKERPSGTRPWLDDPDTFDRKLRQWRLKLMTADGGPARRRTWQEEAAMMRKGPAPMAWNDIAAAVGKPRIAVVSAVRALERKGVAA